MIAETFRSGLFADRIALVSGGTSGIGAAIAALLARLGARVTVTGVSEAEADAARGAAGFPAERALGLDVRDGAAVAACLCSPAAAFVTGVILPVDGGYLVG